MWSGNEGFDPGLAAPDIQVIEAGWYQRWEEGRLKITFLPAQHWSKRSLNDGGLRLWGAFMLQTDDLSVYYGGDTGYSSHFTEIENCSVLRIMLYWVSELTNPLVYASEPYFAL